MHFSTVTLVSSILLASHAVALVPRSPFAQLFARQTTDACTSSCSTFDTALNDCTTTACLCTATVANGLSTCVNCYYSNTPTKDVLDAANKLINTFEDTCSAFTLPAVTVKTSSGGATTSIPTVVVSSTSPRVTSTTKTPTVVTSVAAGTTVSPPKTAVTAITGGDATTTSSSSSSSGNVIPGLTSGATLAQCQALVVPAAVVLGGFLALM